MSEKQIKKNIISLAAMLTITIVLIAVSCYVKSKKTDSYNENNSAGSYSADNINEYVQYDFVMGTAMTTTLYRKASDTNLSVYAEEISNYVNKLDTEVISWRSEASEVYKLNNRAVNDNEFEISKELFSITSKSLKLCQDTEGALDITLRPVANAWNIEGYDKNKDGEFKIPSDIELSNAKKLTGYEEISCDNSDAAKKNNIKFLKDGLTLDFGAVGKGAALDGIYDILRENDEVCGGIVAVGGSILVFGHKQGEDNTDSYKIGIRDPRGTKNEIMGHIIVPSGEKICISTSGSYEKYVEHNGKRYHHIIDRNTLYPAESGLISVTVYCEDGLYSDGLSTACFVLGYEKSLEVLKKYNAEAIFVTEDNDIYVTDGLKDKFELDLDLYKIQ